MIFRKYGKAYHPVTPNFDSRAMTEIGFQKTGGEGIDGAEFTTRYERIDGYELTATAEGSVQDVVEKEMLASLQAQLLDLEQRAGNAVLVIESEQGKDYPKTREHTTTQTIGNENRLHFQRYTDPPLRVGVYRQRQS